MIVFADGGDVVVVSPPGETAVLSALEVGRLRAALHDAVAEASRREREGRTADERVRRDEGDHRGRGGPEVGRSGA